MVYLETVERKNKKYYYITKNFRIDIKKWKKIRRYIGDKPPSIEQREKAIKEIEAEALLKGFTTLTSKYRYLKDEEAEKLQDVKEACMKLYGKISIIGKKKFDNDFIVRFTYNTNAIEGNRLSLRETSMILTENVIPAGTTPNDYNEALNSKICFDFINEYSGEFNQKFLLQVHKLLTQNTDCRIKGAYRDEKIIITGSEWIPPPPEKTRDFMEKTFQWYYINRKKMHPIELGAILHNKLVRIHPFTDGNGRTARLIANWILLKNHFPMFIIDLRDKINYYKAIEKGDKGNDEEIVHYIAEVLIKQYTFESEKIE
jgi:Fic family protein